MSLPAAPVAEPTESALLQRQLRALDALTEQGLAIGEALAAQAQAAQPGDHVDLGAIAAAHERVARGVRLAILVQSKLVKDSADQAKALARDAGFARDRQLSDRRFSVARIAARATAETQPRADRIVQNALNLLDDEDRYDDQLNRPLGELVAIICQDLGLPEPDWELFADEPWAEAEAATGDPRSPFVGLEPDLEDDARPPPLAGEGDPDRGGEGIPPPLPFERPSDRVFA